MEFDGGCFLYASEDVAGLLRRKAKSNVALDEECDAEWKSGRSVKPLTPQDSRFATVALNAWTKHKEGAKKPGRWPAAGKAEVSAMPILWCTVKTVVY